MFLSTSTTPNEPNVMAPAQKRKVVVFRGGSAANSLVDVFNEVIEKNNCALTYVIPISDNGGSSSELIRVFGGPGIGDVRSMTIFFLQSMISLVLFEYFQVRKKKPVHLLTSMHLEVFVYNAFPTS